MSINFKYKEGIKKEVVEALKQVFDASFPDEQLRGRVNITTEYPLRSDRYPAIVVTITEQELRDVGIGHYQLIVGEDEEVRKIFQWRFQGNIVFNIRALTPLDRDIIADSLAEMMMFGEESPAYKPFFDQIYESDITHIQLLYKNPQPAGDSTEEVPFDDPDMKVFTGSYSIPFYGEFYTDPISLDIVPISNVNIYAYQEGHPVPQGSEPPWP